MQSVFSREKCMGFLQEFFYWDVTCSLVWPESYNICNIKTREKGVFNDTAGRCCCKVKRQFFCLNTFQSQRNWMQLQLGWWEQITQGIRGGPQTSALLRHLEREINEKRGEMFDVWTVARRFTESKITTVLRISGTAVLFSSREKSFRASFKNSFIGML